MRCNCNFTMNPAFSIGITVNFVGVLLRHLVEPTGALDSALCLVQGFAVGLLFVGLLYGSPKTRPFFDRFHAFKQRLLGRT